MNTTHAKGFSIIEIILSLVLIGTVAAAVMSFNPLGGTGVQTMMSTTEQNVVLQEAMENVIAEYYKIALENAYDASNQPKFDTELYMRDDEGNILYEDGVPFRKIRGTFFGPLNSGYDYTFGATIDNMTTFRNKLSNFSQFDPSGTITASAVFDPDIRNVVSNSGAVSLDSTAALRNQSLLLTLTAPNGQTLSYLFVTGSNFPAYLTN